MPEVFLKISGEVQGIGFRYHTVRQAQSLDLVGWVRNAPDGTVEILAQGPKQNLEEFIAWAKTEPPRFAQVKKIALMWRKPQEIFSSFEIRY